MTTERYLVTGGGGFVGKALITALRAAGYDVVSLARGFYPELDQLGVTTARVDISSDLESWWHLFKDCAGVFHTAAKVDMWGPREAFYRTNVVGSRNVVEACTRANVQRLVFTSSPSVIHTGSDLCNVDETLPYPAHFHAFYPETKAQAEREVLAMDLTRKIRTAALRPHLIFGPGDTNLTPTIIERARAGRLIRIGDGQNRVDLTFIDDCVRAHLLAMQALRDRPDLVGGKAYFVSQGDPVELWTWVNEVLTLHNLPPVRRSIPTKVAMGLASLCELWGNLQLRVGRDVQPLLTRFLVSEMATNHYFNIDRARADLHFRPMLSVKAATAHSFVKSCSNSRNF